MNKILIVLGVACVMAGCEFPGSTDGSTDITAQGDVIIIQNDDSTTSLNNKPREENNELAK